MGHGVESNVPWGTRTAIASARKLPSIRASQEIGIGLAMGFVGKRMPRGRPPIHSVQLRRCGARAGGGGGGRRRCIMRMRARWGHVTVFARVSEPPLGAPLSPGAPALAVGACVVVCGGAPLIAHPFAPRRAGRRRRVEDVPPLMEVPAGQPERQVGQGEAVGDLPGQEISHRRLMLRRRCPFGADTGRHAALGGA